MSALGSLVVKLALEHAEFTKGLDKSSQEALRFAKNSERAVNDAVGSFKSLASQMLSFTGILSGGLGLTSLLSKVTQETIKSQQEQAQLEAVLRSTGQAAGFNAQQLNNLADQLAKTSTFGSGDIVVAQTRLLAYTNIMGQQFPAAMQAVIDMSARLGMSLEQSAETIGRALDVPSEGLNALTRQGFRFTESQKELIKEMEQTGRVGEAQTIILNSLTTAYGGAALAAKNTLGGALAELGEQFNTLFTVSTDGATVFTSIIQSLTTSIKVMNGEVKTSKDLFENFLPAYSKFRETMDKELGIARPKAFGDNGRIPMSGTGKTLMDDFAERAAKFKKENPLRDTQSVIERVKASLEEVGDLQRAGVISETEALRYRKMYNDELAKTKKVSTGKSDAQKSVEQALQEERRLALSESAFRANLEKNYQAKLKSDYEKRIKEQEAEEKARIERLLDFQQRQADQNFAEAQRASQQAAEQNQRQYEQMAREVSQAFTNGLFQSFQNGEKFGRAMVRNIVALAQTWFARLFENFVTNGGAIFSRLASGVGAIFSGQASAGDVLTGKGENSIFGQLSSIKDIFSGGNNFITGGIEKLGTFFANGMGGLGDTIGGFLGANAASIADGFAYVGSITQALSGNLVGGALTAIGTKFGGPIGGAIGSAIGSLFGRDRPKMTGSQASGTLTDGVFSGTSGQFGRRNLGLGDGLEQLNKAFSESFNALLTNFGKLGDITTNSIFRSRTNVRGRFDAAFEGGTVSFGQSFGKARGGAAEAGFAQFVETVMGPVLVEAIQKSTLSEGIKKFFDGLTKKEDVLEAINTLAALNTQLKDLPPVFKAIRHALDTTNYTISLAELRERFTNVQTFTSLFYTEQENFATITQQITSQFAALNQALPTTREQYRALVDGITVVDEATTDQFHGLVALAPAMDAYFKRLEQQAEGIEQVNQALAQGLDANLFSTYADFVTAQALAAQGRDFSANLGDLQSRTQRVDEPLLAEIQTLKTEQANTRIVLEAIAKYTLETAKNLSRWNGDGLPETRVI